MKNKLRVYRAMHDLTQEALARKLGVTRQTIVSIENGKYEPSIGLAFKTARLFAVKIEDIFLYEGEQDGVDLPGHQNSV
jgi:putative transcriptional regulator